MLAGLAGAFEPAAAPAVDEAVLDFVEALGLVGGEDGGILFVEDAGDDEVALGGTGDGGGVGDEYRREDVGDGDVSSVGSLSEVAGSEGDLDVVEGGVFEGDLDGVGVVIEAVDGVEAEEGGADGEDA